MRSPYTRQDFDHSPLLAFYELTRACDLRCAHCRAVAQPHRHPLELAPPASRLLIDALARFQRPPLLVLTGGDPLKREDVFDLVEHGTRRGLQVAMTPSATPLVTPEAIRRLRDAGLRTIAFSLDAVDAGGHDAFRGAQGSFEHTLRAIRWARAAGLSVQVNTTLAKHNFEQIDDLAELMAGLDIVLWSVFFLVPVGRALAEQRLGPQEHEIAFEKLHEQSLRREYGIKTTEAPHYRRFVMRRRKDQGKGARPAAPIHGTNDGRGVMFISHTGEIFPSGFLPLGCGRFPQDDPVQVYQSHPTFLAVRDADGFAGKCGQCEYRHICGGSRARAYALTGSATESDPDCAYIPTRVEAVSA
jgi:AdoMet-dependent heme synthase